MLDPAGLLVFALALFAAAALPGPGIAAIVARVIGRGTGGAVAFTLGMAIGDVVWLTLAVTGLAVIAQMFAGLFVALRFLGAAYLLFLAWKLWTAPAAAHATDAASAVAGEGAARLFLAGLAVTLGNPKVMVFYLALLPNLIALERVGLGGWAELALVTLAVLGIVFGAWVLLAARARRLLATPRALAIANRLTGSVMAGAAVWIALR